MSETDRSPAATVDRERDIFLEALEQASPDARDAFVERACAGDPGLRAAVQALLEHHKADAFLETPAVEPVRPTGTEVLRPGEQAGQRIGRYKLLQEIGEGACGTVYMAEQEEPVRRRVALKIIKPGMDSRSVIGRFEAERQALALMDHPNIAKVLDAGSTDTGRPYFVMELVRGIRVTEYCDQGQLSTPERLELFIKICHAIQHAHQKGIIHRDIKPSNILVTLHDGVAVPKVIDFGIAKAIEQRLTDKTVFTQFQAFIGTPAYTSPEQAEMSGLDIDTRSDIYSLGVLLYELLTGETPFDPQRLVESGLDEMRRIIRQEEPIRPSTRVSTLGIAEATVLMRTRQARMPNLVQAIRGDLDWIVMKCLEKDRTQRYPTANDLALDVQRYLESEPVLARPPSTAYRLRKFVVRNRVMVTASAAVGVILIGALVVSSWLAIAAFRAQQEQSRLRLEAEAAQRNEEVQRRLAEHERAVALRRGYASDMNVIQQALAANNYGRVVDLLDRHRPPQGGSGKDEDLRQWEWRYFWNQSRSEAAFGLPRQPIAVNSVLLSPNGRLLVTGDYAGTVKLWDLWARTEVAVISREQQPFGAPPPVFSREGTRLAMVSSEGPRRSKVKLWTVATRQFTGELPCPARLSALAFSADDRHLVTFHHDQRLRTWDLETSQSVGERVIPDSEGGPRSPATFSPDARWLAVRHPAGVQVVEVATGATRSVVENAEGDASSLAFSPDGQLLALGPSLTGTTTDIRIFSTATGEELGALEGHVSWVPSLVFTADGQRLVSAGADQVIRVWDMASRKEAAAFQGHRSEVNSVTATPDGNTIVSGCKDGTLLGWDARKLERQEPFEVLARRVSGVEFFPNSPGMLTVNADGTASWWNTDTLQEIEQVAVLGSNLTRLVIAPDGTRVYAGTSQGGLTVLDWATRLVITNLAGTSGSPRRGGPDLRFLRNQGPIGVVQQGRALVVFAPGLVVRVYDTGTWEKLADWKISEGPPAFFGPSVLSPNQKFLVTGGSGSVDFRNVLNGEVESTVAAQNWGVSGLAFAPDGELLAISSIDGTVNLWDAAQQKQVDVLRGHLLGVHAVAFSPDGERLATISHGNEAVKLWDVQTRHEVATLAGHGSFFTHARFSPDGRLLIAINRQRSAYLWRAPSREEIAAAEAQETSGAPL